MIPISEADRAHLITRLEGEKKELEVELNAIGRKNPTNTSDWEAKPPEANVQPGDRDEVADTIEGFEENTAILKELETRWNLVNRALLKHEQGMYGICEKSNEPIELERLEADPAARTCITHKDASLT
jgi:RNA polymerase-binding transcription factor DksA